MRNMNTTPRAAVSVLRAARFFFAGFYCYAYYYFFGNGRKSLTGKAVC